MKNLVLFIVFTSALTTAAQEFSDVGDAFNSGVILKSQKKYDDAVAEFERAITIASSSNDEKSRSTAAKAKQQIVNCHILTANNLYENGAFDEAIGTLENAKNTAKFYNDAANLKLIDEAMPRMIFAKSAKAMEAGNFEEALMSINMSLDLNPNQSNVLLWAGVCYAKLGNTEKALEFYEKSFTAATAQTQPKEAAEARKAAVSYLLSAGQEAKDMKYYDGAYKYFSMLTKFDPQNADGYLQMAIVANFNKKYKDAIDAAQKGIVAETRMQQSSQIAYQLAYAYEQNTPQDHSKACEFYQQAERTIDIQIKQNSKDALRRLRCKR